MTQLRSYTTIEQSKKLAEILPLESADMYFQYVLPKSSKIKHNPEIGNPVNALEWYNKGYSFGGKEPITLDEYCVPCWSLAALLDVLPDTMLGKDKDGYVVMAETMGSGQTTFASNSIDACYEMILKLHDKNLI